LEEEEDTEDEPEELEVLPKKTRSKKKISNDVIISTTEKDDIYVDISVELEEEAFSDDDTNT